MAYPKMIYKQYPNGYKIVNNLDEEVEWRGRGYKTHREQLGLVPEPEMFQKTVTDPAVDERQYIDVGANEPQGFDVGTGKQATPVKRRRAKRK